MPCSSAKRKKLVPKGSRSGLGKGRHGKLGCHLGQHFGWLVFFGLEVGMGGSVLNSFSSGHGVSRHTHTYRESIQTTHTLMHPYTRAHIYTHTRVHTHAHPHLPGETAGLP